jgi:hypothetical protein
MSLSTFSSTNLRRERKKEKEKTNTPTKNEKIKFKKLLKIKGPDISITYCNLGLLFFLLNVSFFSFLQKVNNNPWFEIKFVIPYH